MATLVLMTAGGVASVTGSTTAGNLIINGGFESGNTGFTSDYAYNVTTYAAGEYTIGSNASQAHSGFVGTAYAGSNFFIGNGAEDTTQTVWQSQAFNVTEVGVSYRFEAQISSLVPPVWNGTPLAPPSLAFEISSNGGSSWTGLGSTVDLTGAAAGEWFESYADTTLTQAGSYLIRLRNAQSAYSGNDFGIDGIYFGLAATSPSAGSSTPVPGVGGIAAIAGLGLAGRRRRR
jgi:LPXTG-motif cell wall-anchored protein